MSAIVRYHIQRGGLYLGDDRHATDDVPLWCEWGDPFVCWFSDLWEAEHWRKKNDGSRIRVSINGELVTSRDEAIAQERERCAKICADLASEYQAKWLEAEARGGRSMEYYIRSATAAECERKIRGEG